MSTETKPAGMAPKLRLVLGHGWRMVLGAVVGLVLFGIAYQGYSPDAATDVEAVGALVGADMLCGVAALVLYPFRHRFPLAITVSLVLLSIPSTLSAGFMMLAIISLATGRKPLRIAAVGLLVVFSAVVGDHLFGKLWFPAEEAMAWWETVLAALVVLAILLPTGLYIGGRRQLAESRRQQWHAAQGERDAQIHAAKADERTRLAREMHDVLAHRLSLVALHSGALEYRSDLTPEQTRQAAGIIRENSHLALGELREVLGMLRAPGTLFDEELERPQPVLGQLESILADSRSVGTAVDLHLEAQTIQRLQTLPTSTGRHLYRIIQEVLTNARRHAPGREVRLDIDGHRGDSLHLRAANRLRADGAVKTGPAQLPASGLGLSGLAERVRLAGGHVHIDPDDSGSFVLEVWLPWGP